MKRAAVRTRAWRRPELALLALLGALCSVVPVAADVASAEVQIVATAAELKLAITAGAAHVHVTNHIDLTGVVPAQVDSEDGWATLFTPGALLKSLTVRP